LLYGSTEPAIRIATPFLLASAMLLGCTAIATRKAAREVAESSAPEED
jgi:hypothetical protein